MNIRDKTIVAALITSLGAIIAAYIGRQIIVDRGEVQQVQSELAQRDSAINDLRASLEKAQHEIAHLSHERKTRLKPTPVDPPRELKNRPDDPIPSQASTHAEPLPKPVVFETPFYNFLVTSVTKSGRGVRVGFLLEATIDKAVHASYGSCSWWGGDQIYLLDENGERWELNYDYGDTRRFTNNFGSVELLPRTRVKGGFLFLANGQASGTKFTLTVRECNPSQGAQVIIHDLSAT